MNYQWIVETEIGRLRIVQEEEAITGISKDDLKVSKDILEEETPLIKEVTLELEEYFKGERKTFDLPLAPKGTEFQKKVWKALEEIPYGETRSYKEVAEAVGNPKGARAIGMANNRNPIMIVIPCHRVIGANGNLVGYGGGLEMKEKLLNLEKESDF